MQTQSADPRIAAMFRSDRIFAYGSLVVLWATYAIVFWSLRSTPGSSAIMIVLAVAGAVVLLLNTVSIFAMTRHFEEDKEHIYGLDLYYIDALKKSKG